MSHDYYLKILLTGKIPDSNAQVSFLPLCSNEIIPSKFGAIKGAIYVDMISFPKKVDLVVLLFNC